jgi:ubiquinone biosynthesis monooxygenase Coq7
MNSMDKEKEVARAIRVNHAGEFGATRIYAGQLAVLKDKSIGKEIAAMAKQEEAHLQYFEKEMVARKVRPSVLHPVWHVAGYAVGMATALLGKEAAMACTVAVEEAIDDHYKAQLASLPEEERDLKEHVAKFREEELEHREIGLANNATKAPAYALLHRVIKQGSKVAIWCAERS